MEMAGKHSGKTPRIFRFFLKTKKKCLEFSDFARKLIRKTVRQFTPRHVRRKISTSVNVGPSGGSRVRWPACSCYSCISFQKYFPLPGSIFFFDRELCIFQKLFLVKSILIGSLIGFPVTLFKIPGDNVPAFPAKESGAKSLVLYLCTHQHVFRRLVHGVLHLPLDWLWTWAECPCWTCWWGRGWW